MEAWRKRLAAILELSVVEKGLIPFGFVIFTYTEFLLWCVYTSHRADQARLVNMPTMRVVLALSSWVIAGAGVAVLLGLWLRRVRPGVLWYQHISTQYFSLSFVALSYFIGTLNFAAGVVALGAPIFGFIVLESSVVWLALTVAFAAMAALLGANLLHLLPYAPLVAPGADKYGNLFWLTSFFLFATPHLFVILLAADYALDAWRKREQLIRELSRTDALTGIHNRRSIMEMVDREILRSMRHTTPLAVALMDLDFFKRVNDTWGHPTGDVVLEEAARVLRSTIRQSDAVGRYGGEEFLLVLADTNLAGAAIIVERCRARLAEIVITAGNGDTVKVSGSFGLASNEHYVGMSAEALIRHADEALYRAKERGRNRVEIAGVMTGT